MARQVDRRQPDYANSPTLARLSEWRQTKADYQRLDHERAMHEYRARPPIIVPFSFVESFARPLKPSGLSYKTLLRKIKRWLA